VRIAIFGAEEDPITRALVREVAACGDQALIVEFDALERGLPVGTADDKLLYRGERLDQVDGAILRFIPAPSVPVLEEAGELRLYEDWYAAFMQAREKAAFYMSWLLQLELAGVPLVNPPQAGSVHQFKPFQLDVLRRAGARVPRTLITNDPAAVEAFAREIGEVIYKPVMGGALTRVLDAEARSRLELITHSPVIFQERAAGDDVRVTLVGDRVVSTTVIEVEEGNVDYRGDAQYAGGHGRYREVAVPEAVIAHCREAMRTCKLEFAGIDLKHRGDDWVFLELNSSPVYLEIEQQLGHPISRELVAHVRRRAAARSGR